MSQDGDGRVRSHPLGGSFVRFIVEPFFGADLYSTRELFRVGLVAAGKHNQNPSTKHVGGKPPHDLRRKTTMTQTRALIL